MAARRVRSPDYSFLLLHSAGAPLFCPQAARSPFQLDVRHVRGFHSGLRHHAPDGSVDGMARQLPGIRSDQSDYRIGIRDDSAAAITTGS